MYQIITYDTSYTNPLIISKDIFNNEDCAWAYYDMKAREKEQQNKKINLEFKIIPNRFFSNYAL